MYFIGTIKRLRNFYLLLIFTFTHQLAKSQYIDSLRYVIDSAYVESPFNANILIIKNNRILFEKSYGYADAVRKIVLTKKNSFQVASISKQFTAYGIMLLNTNGLLDYDGLVKSYIADFPYDTITIKHLLTHTSGLPDFWSEIRPNLDTTKANGNKEMLEYLKQHKLPLQFEPGSKFAYSDIGYDLLALIIENISGQSYEAYLMEKVFKPLKMNDTYAYMVTDIREIDNNDLAIGHVQEKGKYVFAHKLPKYNFVFYLGNFYGDGSVVTTARDLAIWDKTLKDAKLLAMAGQDEVMNPYAANGQLVGIKNDTELGYGFGLNIEKNLQGNYIYHSERHPGNLHFLYRFMDKDVTLIFLSNGPNADTKKLNDRIIQLLNH